MAKGRIIEGCGIVYMKPSHNLGGFVEQISPLAIGPNMEVLKSSDIVFLLNHDVSRGVLARATNGKGSLGLTVKDDGVYYRFEAPATGAGPELIENLERGDLNASSFSFTIAGGGESWEKTADGYLRTITRFDRLYDISAVYRAAYPQTTCSTREGVLSRAMSADWTEGHKRAERSGDPQKEQHQMCNACNLLDMKIGDRVDGDELIRMINLLETRGVKVPGIPAALLTHHQRHEFEMDYIKKANDIKPSISRMSAEERRITAEWEAYRKANPDKKG